MWSNTALFIFFYIVNLFFLRLLLYEPSLQNLCTLKEGLIPFLSSGTTKGTGGDILILEEAAYVDCDFFYETVAPLLLVGVTSLICISTLTSDIK